MARWTAILSFVGLSLISVTTNGLAQTQADDLKSLRGLPGVGLVIEGLPERGGENPAVTTTGEIRADVEPLLTQAGIRVLSRAELEKVPARPSLQLSFGFVRTPGDVEFYIVQITLRQWATLTSGQAMSVRTFEDATAEWTAAADHKTRVRNAVKEEVSRFINAWGIANRK